jgi:acetaldehyde dehydrogenase/alcohol dehydrogenase
MSNLLMKECDCILATGGPGMVHAAYSSGKPALGVGPGNVPAVIDESADILLAVNSIIHSKTFDNGMICASEQSVIVPKAAYAEGPRGVRAPRLLLPQGRGARQGSQNPAHHGALNAKIVGQSAVKIADWRAVAAPPETKVLIGEVESVDNERGIRPRKALPVLAMYKAKDFDDAMGKAERLILDGGHGHTASVPQPRHPARKLDRFAAKMETCRVVVNTPSSHGGIGDLYNFKLLPSLTLGAVPGAAIRQRERGRQAPAHVKTVAERRENMLWFRTRRRCTLRGLPARGSPGTVGVLGQKAGVHRHRQIPV